MHIVPHKHGPVLGRVWGFVDLLSNHLAQPRLLSEPLAGRACNRMPTDLDSAGLAIDFDLARGDRVGRLAEAKFLLDLELPFQKTVFSGTASVCGSPKLVLLQSDPQERAQLASGRLPARVRLVLIAVALMTEHVAGCLCRKLI